MNIDLAKLSISELNDLSTLIYRERQKREEKEKEELERELINLINKIEDKGFDIYTGCKNCKEDVRITFDDVYIER